MFLPHTAMGRQEAVNMHVWVCGCAGFMMQVNVYDVFICVWNVHVSMTGASLSKPHTSGTALQLDTCLCMCIDSILLSMVCV